MALVLGTEGQKKSHGFLSSKSSCAQYTKLLQAYAVPLRTTDQTISIGYYILFIGANSLYLSEKLQSGYWLFIF